jgi:hypothetical protein
MIVTRGGFITLLPETRSVPLNLFDQDRPDTLDQPNTIRGHSQKALRHIDARFDQYGCCSISESTLCESLALRSFVKRHYFRKLEYGCAK